MKIAISGANGLIGKYLVNHFLEKTDYHLKLSYRKMEEVPQSVLNNQMRCSVIVGDLNEITICANFLEDVDVLIHLAQKVLPKINTGSWQIACKEGCDSTFVIYDLLRKREKPLHVIYPSSGGTVYSCQNDKKVPFTEDLIPRPVSPYGIQKLMHENYFSLLSSLNPNITTNVLRISNPYGSILSVDRGQGFIGIAMSRIKNNELIEIWGDINSTRDYVHLKDLNRAFELALNYKNGYQVFNIGSGVGVSLKDLIELFSSILGEKINYKIIESLKENYFPDWNVLDISKAKMYLKWSPEISLEEGVQSLVEKVLSN